MKDAGSRKSRRQAAGLDEELELLRTCVRRLWSRMLVDDEAGNDPKLMHTLVQMVRAIAAVERVRLLGGGRDGGLEKIIREAVGALNPFRDL